jgi:hypothetical protein
VTRRADVCQFAPARRHRSSPPAARRSSASRCRSRAPSLAGCLRAHGRTAAQPLPQWQRSPCAMERAHGRASRGAGRTDEHRRHERAQREDAVVVGVGPAGARAACQAAPAQQTERPALRHETPVITGPACWQPHIYGDQMRFQLRCRPSAPKRSHARTLQLLHAHGPNHARPDISARPAPTVRLPSIRRLSNAAFHPQCPRPPHASASSDNSPIRQQPSHGHERLRRNPPRVHERDCDSDRGRPEYCAPRTCRSTQSPQCQHTQLTAARRPAPQRPGAPPTATRPWSASRVCARRQSPCLCARVACGCQYASREAQVGHLGRRQATEGNAVVTAAAQLAKDQRPSRKQIVPGHEATVAQVWQQRTSQAALDGCGAQAAACTSYTDTGAAL